MPGLSLERISLTRRLALLFAASTALVSLVAGLLFNQASERHFRELDEQLLASKLEVHRQLLGRKLGPENLDSRLPALEEELRRHPPPPGTAPHEFIRGIEARLREIAEADDVPVLEG